MSETMRYSPWAEPGTAVVTFLPKITEHSEPGGVNWTTRQSSLAAKSASSLQPKAVVKVLGAIDVCNRDDDDLKLHVDRPCGGCGVWFDHGVELAHDGLLLWRLGALM